MVKNIAGTFGAAVAVAVAVAPDKAEAATLTTGFDIGGLDLPGQFSFFVPENPGVLGPDTTPFFLDRATHRGNDGAGMSTVVSFSAGGLDLFADVEATLEVFSVTNGPNFDAVSFGLTVDNPSQAAGVSGVSGRIDFPSVFDTTYAEQALTVLSSFPDLAASGQIVFDNLSDSFTGNVTQLNVSGDLDAVPVATVPLPGGVVLLVTGIASLNRRVRGAGASVVANAGARVSAQGVPTPDQRQPADQPLTLGLAA